MNKINSIIPELFAGENIICGFTTRTGGVSSQPFDSLNLGTGTSDDINDVMENYRILYNNIGISADCAAYMKQVHGDNVVIAEHSGVYPSTDSLVTNRIGLLLGVKTADCLPLLLFDPVSRSIGAVHCGWRSLVSGIAEKTVRIMTTHFGAVPGNIKAAGGQYAHSCCYEIGEEIRGQFKPESVETRDGKLYADLACELRIRLESEGLISENISFYGGCTVCNRDLFFSHRRDGLNSGRMLGYIMVK
jgi:polyphenol oxidase